MQLGDLLIMLLCSGEMHKGGGRGGVTSEGSPATEESLPGDGGVRGGKELGGGDGQGQVLAASLASHHVAQLQAGALQERGHAGHCDGHLKKGRLPLWKGEAACSALECKEGSVHLFTSSAWPPVWLSMLQVGDSSPQSHGQSW